MIVYLKLWKKLSYCVCVVVLKEFIHTPKLLDRLNYESKSENKERIRSWDTLIGLQHFKGRGVC
jgi:hypothetical protein